MENTPLRQEMLQNAIKLTVGDRDNEYGPPYENLSSCAMLFTAYLEAKYGAKMPCSEPNASSFMLTAEDVAWLNVLQKIARTCHGNVKSDTYTDAAAYAAIAGECAVEETKYD